ncbi:MAG: phosphate uptake regulator PhoU [Candidatus Woesearchaeota archaeon]
MKRKVIKQGNGTLTITLPKEWTKKSNLKGGDEIDVIEKDKSLVVGGHKDDSVKEIKIDVSNLDRTTLQILIQSIYRYGYDLIEVISHNPMIAHHRLGKKVSTSSVIYDSTNRLVGAEVISASSKRYVIKRIAEESINDFPTILRRIFRLLNEMIDSFIQSVKTNDNEMIKSIEFQHINLKKFINFCLRLLNRYGYEDSRKTCFYFNIISLLSKVEDIIKNNSRYTLKHKIKIQKKKTFELLEDIKDHIRMFYELFFNYKLEKIAELNKQRDIFREKLFKYTKDMSKEENLVIGGLSQIVELILDMTETRMALES